MRDIRLPTVISDERQRDPKSRKFADDMGITKHEKQTFPMGVRLPDVAPDEIMVERLVNDIKNRAVHSYKASTTPRGRTVKVTVCEYSPQDIPMPGIFTWKEAQAGRLFDWEVREKGITLRIGFALLFADGKTILWDTSSPVGEKPLA